MENLSIALSLDYSVALLYSTALYPYEYREVTSQKFYIWPECKFWIFVFVFGPGVGLITTFSDCTGKRDGERSIYGYKERPIPLNDNTNVYQVSLKSVFIWEKPGLPRPV